MLRRLLVPLDGSELAERALPYAVRLASSRGGRLVLVRVALAPPPAGLDWERQQLAELEQARAYLSGVVKKLGTPGLAVETAAPYGRAAVQILETVTELDADGVVIDIGRAAEALRTVMGELSYRNLDEELEFNTTTEALARLVADRLAERLGGLGLDGLVVTLHESHVAWASYERAL
jgi:hypothetical protein